MPKWVKVAVAIVAVGVILLVAAGFAGARALKRTMDNFNDDMEQARVDGEVFGMSATLDGCVEEAVLRSGVCAGASLTCAPIATGFLWACLEEAPYDPDFCARVPPAGNDQAMIAWGKKVCRRHGAKNVEICALAVSPSGGFCYDRKNNR